MKINHPNLEICGNLAYILGVLKGDGSVYITHKKRKNKDYVIVLRVKDLNFAKEFKRSLIRIGLNPVFYKDAKGLFSVVGYSKIFYEWYKSLTLEDIELMLSSEQLICDFLRGFYQSEGCLSRTWKTTREKKYPDVRISNTDFQLMEMLNRFLQKLGFLNKLFKRKPSSPWCKQPFEYYFTLTCGTADKFLNLIGCEK